MKTWRYQKGYARISSLDTYKAIESNKVETTHSQLTLPGSEHKYIHWLKTYGLESWSITSDLPAQKILKLVN